MNKKLDLAIKDKPKKNGISVVYYLSKSSSPMHWHDFWELEIVLDGSGQTICNDKRYTIQRGMVSYLTPTDSHQYIITSDMYILRIQFTLESINPEILKNFIDLTNNIIYINEEQITRITSICQLLKDNNIPGKTGDIYASQLLQSLLFSLKDEFESGSTITKKTPLPIQKALLYIHSHFKENPQLDDISKYLFLSKSYFCSLFKETMGESYKDYIRKLKLNYAMDLIRYSNLPITQISLDSGYTTPSHFNRDFKAFFGISPSDIRRNSESAEKKQ